MCELSADFEWWFIADLNRTMRMRTVCFTTFSMPMVGIEYNSGNIRQNENRFLAFGSLISNAEVETAMISDLS